MFLSLCWLAVGLGADPVEKPGSAKEALQRVNTLVAPWKGTGFPDGTREERNKGFWTEKSEWAWAFTGDQTSLKWTIAEGKYYRGGELRYLLKPQEYELRLTAVDKSEQVFRGSLTFGKQKEAMLVFERNTETEVQQLTFTLLHSNRHLYQLATKPKDAKAFTRFWQVGATKEGEPFAETAKGPECIMSGGRGTISVSFQGKTYWVCCSGCKDEFNSDPEKYIKLAAEKKK